MNQVVRLLKVIGVAIAGLFILIVAQVVSSVFYRFHLFGVEYILQSLVCIVVMYILLKLLVEKVLRKRMADLCITPFVLKKEWLLLAFLLPVSVIIVTLFLVPGTFSVSQQTIGQSSTIVFYAFFSVGLAASIVEECIFRGLIFSTVSEYYGQWVGILVPSILFGSLHLLNGRLNLSSFLLLILGGSLVGILFSLLTDKNGTIWASVIVHGIWNFLVIGGLCHFGIEKESEVLANYVFTEQSFFLTGGDFGIEVSVIAIIGYCFSIIYLCRKRKVKKECD